MTPQEIRAAFEIAWTSGAVDDGPTVMHIADRALIEMGVDPKDYPEVLPGVRELSRGLER